MIMVSTMNQLLISRELKVKFESHIKTNIRRRVMCTFDTTSRDKAHTKRELKKERGKSRMQVKVHCKDNSKHIHRIIAFSLNAICTHHF